MLKWFVEIINKGAITMDHIHSNTIEDVPTFGRHLSLEDRGMLQALHHPGLSLRSIAAAIECAHTTIFYELRRGTPVRKSKHGRTPQYMAKRGQKLTQRIEKTPENLVKLTMTTANRSSNGW